jgi:predicted esterase
MTRYARRFVASSFWVFVFVASARGADEDKTFDGPWRTSISTVKLTQTGNEVTGTYGNDDKFTIRGTVDGKNLTFEYDEGQNKGNGNWTLAESGDSFTGGFKSANGQAGVWKGWRPDPDAANGKTAELGGLWLTDLGLMELKQTGEKVKGRYALGGVSTIEGKVAGRTFSFKYKGFRGGKGWFDVSEDGETLAGAATTNGFASWYGWSGRKTPEFARHVKLMPGKIVDGSTKGLLTYSVRAPEDFKEADGKKWPAIVILHGSNMNGKAYANTLAAGWPEIAKDYLLIGINGEMPSAMGAEPAFNYTYINYVGRSTYKGFPGTDRESPALVAEALEDLREAYPIAKYFVGGHSQGGFLTYGLLMNFPEKIAGAFPISAGVIFQCEPSAYADTALRAAQRAVPLAIIHGKQDPLVNFSMGEYAAVIFGEESWPAFRFFNDSTGAGHMFGRLPVGRAIRWLEAHTSDDPTKLLDVAEKCLKAKANRDAVALLNRAATLQLDDTAKTRLESLSSQIDSQARARAATFLTKIQKGEPGKAWIDKFLNYREDFEFAPAAREVMQAFNTLRAEHEEPARKSVNEARAAFQQGKRDEGYAKYQEIADKYYAASSYRNVKKWIAERK